MDIPKPVTVGDLQQSLKQMSTPSMSSETVEALTRPMREKVQRDREATESTNFLASFQRANLASQFAQQVLSRITRFDEDLDEEKEVGVKLVTFGQAVTFHVDSVGYSNPSLVLFNGFTDNGERVELIQNVSQISFLLLALPKLNPEEPKRQIGFIQDND